MTCFLNFLKQEYFFFVYKYIFIKCIEIYKKHKQVVNVFHQKQIEQYPFVTF